MYKPCPKYKHSGEITLRQIQALYDEYEAISNQQKICQIDRECLLEINIQTVNWTNQDNHVRQQHPIH